MPVLSQELERPMGPPTTLYRAHISALVLWPSHDRALRLSHLKKYASRLCLAPVCQGHAARGLNLFLFPSHPFETGSQISFLQPSNLSAVLG